MGGAAHGYVWTFLCGEIARYGRGGFIVSPVGKQLGNKLNTSRRLAGGLANCVSSRTVARGSNLCPTRQLKCLESCADKGRSLLIAIDTSRPHIGPDHRGTVVRVLGGICNCSAVKFRSAQTTEHACRRSWHAKTLVVVQLSHRSMNNDVHVLLVLC